MPFLHHSNHGAKTQSCIKMYKTSKTKENFQCVHNIFAVASTAGVQDIWVHPLNEECTEKGEFYTHYTDHRQFDDHFFELYRMTVAQFDELLYKVGPAIVKKETKF